MTEPLATAEPLTPTARIGQLCRTCGATLCCGSSPNRHATRYARVTGHPVIASAEPGERWLYCYPDDAYAEY